MECILKIFDIARKAGFMKKRIICFGDSNTWGYNPLTGERYDENIRWPMRMQSLLGEDYQIIEEGQNGRTIACEDPWEWGNKKALDYILPMVESHRPFDLLIIMLGSNDLKKKFNLPAGDIAGSLKTMLMHLKGFLQYKCGMNPKVLIVSPVWIGEGISESRFAEFFDGENTVQNSKRLAYWYEEAAKLFEYEYFDASTVAQEGLIDCLHMEADGHEKLANALAEAVRNIFN